ncbi:hypothetical protein LWI29_016629 [Acer saccharum]|uniref:Uncharacterized protein n=1 Tax=Acer saccharum TaxID=4024 RepID=A0AA39T052_ACESA|nr:hypothetical protein LWI29_016629 [Acer saccharum]
MAENQTAEDDDEEGFGDFTFAAPAAVPPQTNIKINGGGPDLSFNNLKINGGGNYDDDDDDWGDFVTFPTVSHSQSMKAKPFDDPFSFVSDPAPNPVESKWVNQVERLPLSCLEKWKRRRRRRRRRRRKYQLAWAEFGFKWIELDSNGLNSVSDGDFSWEFKGSEPKLAAGDFNFKTDHLVKAGNGPDSDFSVFNLGRNVLGSDLNGLSSKPSGVNQMTLNFNGVVLDTNGLSSNFNGVNLDANRLSSNFNGVNADANGSSLVDDNENFGDDDEWEFQDAKSEMQSENSNSKVNSKEPENFVGNGVHDPTNLFVASDGISQKSGEWDFGFEFNKSSVTQDVTNCNSYSSTKAKER